MNVKKTNNKYIVNIVCGTVFINNNLPNFWIRVLLAFFGIYLMSKGLEDMYNDLGSK